MGRMRVNTSIVPWILISLTFLSCRSAVQNFGSKNEVGATDHALPAMATYRGKVSGYVYFGVFRRPATPISHPIQNCVLQHGYGVNQGLLDAVLNLNKTVGTVKEGYSAIDGFAAIYFGRVIIDELLASTCETVYVPVQESNNTTVFEMTKRTEMFLRDEVCKVSSKPNQIGCALIGHSKGGAVAFNIARRCMEKTSTIGEAGCRQLGKIYSATGTVQGAGAPALVLGAKLLAEEGHHGLANRVFDALDGCSGAYSKLLLNLGNSVWDLKSNKTSNTNPTWFDLSPLAPMENNRPIYLVNDIVLEKKNWLVADYSASGTQFQFDGRLTTGVGCGTRAPAPRGKLEATRHFAHEELCRAFGESLGGIHAENLESVFEKGVAGLHKIALLQNDLRPENGSTDFLENALSWSQYQVGDGFADYHLALGPCLKGLDVPGSAVRSCKTFSNLNHQASAGGAAEARAHIIDSLKN